MRRQNKDEVACNPRSRHLLLGIGIARKMGKTTHLHWCQRRFKNQGAQNEEPICPEMRKLDFFRHLVRR